MADFRETAHNLLGVVIEQVPAGRSRPTRALRLFLEGLVYTAVALAIASGLDVPQSGFIAVFLGAAGLTPRFDRIITDNRLDIFERNRRPRDANAKTAISVLAIFLGSFAAFTAAALWTGEAQLERSFGFVLESANLGKDTILTRTFASALGLFVHNALVLLVFALLALVYRGYGALLALVWNACGWGLVITFLVRRGMAASTVPVPVFVSASLLAVLPHLVLEATGYVLGALAAIFLSKALAKYALTDPTFRAVLRAVLELTLVALACLLAGALVEATVPHAVLARLAG